MKEVLDCSVGGFKHVSAVNGGYLEGTGRIVIVSEKNIKAQMGDVYVYSQPRFSKIERFIIEVGDKVFVEYVKSGYDISGSGLKEFKRVDDTTVMINMSSVCMIESFWLAEFNYQAYDGEFCPRAVLIRDNDEAVCGMLETGNIH